MHQLRDMLSAPVSLAVISGFLVLLGLVGTTPQPAIYIDNGYDQTAIDRDLTPAEKHDMELDILEVLGLTRRPQHSSTHNSLRKSAPRFLLDVYKRLMEEEQEGEDSAKRSKRSTKGTTSNLSGEEQNAIDESDVIMTFESVEHHVNEVRHERGKRLWFNISEVPVAENVVGAELQIFKKPALSLKDSQQLFTITVYELITTDTGEISLEYISARNTSGTFTGWLKFNVSACLPSWVAFPNTNKGVYLSVHPIHKPGHEIRPDEIGLVTIKGPDETQPFLVAFLKATHQVKPTRLVRAVEGSSRRRVKKADYQSVMRGITHDGTHDSWRTCKIHTLYISFKDLQWQDWIIAPEGYAAYYCAGECNFPLNAHMNATNHAIVQTLVHLMNPLKYPKPCCAPTKLTPISVLYFLDDTNVILKKYKKMVVKSCGCH